MGFRQKEAFLCGRRCLALALHMTNLQSTGFLVIKSKAKFRALHPFKARVTLEQVLNLGG